MDNSNGNVDYWKKRILFTLWLTYATYYLCRINISIAIPEIIQELGFSKTIMGGILSSFLAAYCIGQFVSGRLGDEYGSRKLVTAGIFSSAILNLAFGLSSTIPLMVFFWGLNGFFQSTGWAPSIRNLANWFPSDEIGRAGGIMGTSYLVGTILSWLLAGVIIDSLGWRWGFWIPSILFMLSGVHWYMRSRNKPADVGLNIKKRRRSLGKDISQERQVQGEHTLTGDLTSFTVVYSALALFFLNIIRYGIISWLPTFLSEIQDLSLSIVTLESIVVPSGGLIGVLGASWISDKFSEGRRGPVGAAMGIVLGTILLLYPHFPLEGILLIFGLLSIGITFNGPNILLVGLIPMDVGEGKTTSSIAGFLNGIGYVGGILTGFCTGLIVDLFSWNGAFYFWAFSGFAASFFMWMVSKTEIDPPYGILG